MSLDRLEKIIPSNPATDADQEDAQGSKTGNVGDAVVEISGDDDGTEEEQLQRLKALDAERANVMRIRAKSLLRRAKAKSQMGGWANLQGAAEDYQALAGMENIPAEEKRIVQRALQELPDRIKEAREKEMGEMMSKLKDVSGAFPVEPAV